MKALAWWLIPAVAFVLALVWVSFKNRVRPPAKAQDSMAEHLRFQRAMQRQTESKPRPLASPADPSAPTDPADPTGSTGSTSSDPTGPPNPFAAS